MPNAAIGVLLATELWRIKPARQARALAAYTNAPTWLLRLASGIFRFLL